MSKCCMRICRTNVCTYEITVKFSYQLYYIRNEAAAFSDPMYGTMKFMLHQNKWNMSVWTIFLLLKSQKWHERNDVRICNTEVCRVGGKSNDVLLTSRLYHIDICWIHSVLIFFYYNICNWRNVFSFYSLNIWLEWYYNKSMWIVWLNAFNKHQEKRVNSTFYFMNCGVKRRMFTPCNDMGVNDKHDFDDFSSEKRKSFQSNS